MVKRSGCKGLERSGKERGEGDGGGGGGGSGRDGVSGGGGGGSSGRHWVSGGGGGSVKDGVSNSRITWRYLQLHRYGF